jgi:hypothetical protein
MSIPEVKSMNDRTTESINLIKQIKDLGISVSDPSYIEVKEHLNTWIKSEEHKVLEYEIYFTRYGRRATLTLPWKADKTCEFSMRKPFGV